MQMLARGGRILPHSSSPVSMILRWGASAAESHPARLPVSSSNLLLSRGKKTAVKICPDNASEVTRDSLQPEKGKIYDKKPFKFRCEAGKMYLWCTCGWSKNQPFCDSTHKNTHYRLKLKPVTFIAKETKDYMFCNCKQTSSRPLCDGTHKRDDIQAAIRS